MKNNTCISILLNTYLTVIDQAMEQPYREVFKCSWLKLPLNEKKTASLTKQWVIFCVHNDSIPFLEVYADEKTASTHKPNASYQLTNVLHITPSICPHDDEEFEFVITFPSEMIRLTASSQHQMMSWVKRLNVKLREMKLLAPSENLYTSHPPENRSHLLPTRDPNSPLPLPPTMPYIPPGVEPVSSSSGENAENPDWGISDARHDNSENEVGSSPNNFSNSALLTVVPVDASNEHFVNTNSTNEELSQQTNSPVDLVPSSHNRLCDSNNAVADNARYVTNNVTVIEVSTMSANNHIFSFNNIGDELNAIERTPEVSTAEVMPISVNFENAIPARSCSRSSEYGNNSHVNGNENVDSEPSRVQDERLPPDPTLFNNTTDVYEHVFLSTAAHLGSCNSQPPASPCLCVPLSPVAVENKLHSPFASVNLQSSTSSQVNKKYRPVSYCNRFPKMGRGRGNIRGRRRSNSNSEGSSNHQMVAADRIRTTGPLTSPNQRLQPAPHPFVRQTNSEESANTKLTLREQQVMQLRREMSHPGGVRLQLRRKDCLNSIAFIDAFQSVWIAGWKQKEHPMLYAALHIGDQLISLGGKIVNNAADAQKLIRAWPSLYIEFVIRRIPYGRVYALRKEQDGQNLGIVQENNTAEIKEVLSKSLIAVQGLNSRVRTMNGLSWTTWYITEINGRPLNLFFRDNEVRDRLNAVGLDISLLVQPSDLIKQIKKQLKLIKNYKDYIVQ